MEITILETNRLLLRPLTVEDAKAVFVWVSDERVTKYMPYQTYTSIIEVRTWLSSLQSENNAYNFGFVFKENKLLIGSGHIGYSNENKSWEFGYNIRHDYWNRGIATEATKCMMKYAYEVFGARDFCARHAVDNPASGRVIEKCGLTFDHYGQCGKFDGSETFISKFYTAHLDVIM